MANVLTFLFFIPFLIPLILLSLISTQNRNPNSLENMSNFLEGKSLYFWLFQILVGALFGSMLGVVATLILPNLIFLIAYSPLFLGRVRNQSRILREGLFAVISTVVFWSLSVGSHNWKASALAFIFIIPALFVAVGITTFILFSKSASESKLKNDFSQANPKKSGYRYFIFGAVSLLIFITAKNIYFDWYENQEVSRKISLACKVGRTLTNLNGQSKLTTEKAISEQVFTENYQIKQNKVIHKYGGSIEIREDGDMVYMSYKSIPGGNVCINTAYLNSLASYGYADLFIDSRKIGFTKTQSFNDNVRGACNSSGVVQIDFAGSKESIIEKQEYCKNY